MLRVLFVVLALLVAATAHAQRHYETMQAEQEPIKPGRLTIVDDVITKGALAWRSDASPGGVC